jgi:hypothetical protein
MRSGWLNSSYSDQGFSVTSESVWFGFICRILYIIIFPEASGILVAALVQRRQVGVICRDVPTFDKVGSEDICGGMLMPYLGIIRASSIDAARQKDN